MNEQAPAEAAAAEPAAVETPRVVWPTTTVTLDHPVDDGEGGTLEQLILREPDVEALERIEDLDAQEGEKLKIRHMRVIAAALARQPDDVIRRLHARDFTKVSEALAPFLEQVVAGAVGPPS